MNRDNGRHDIPTGERLAVRWRVRTRPMSETGAAAHGAAVSELTRDNGPSSIPNRERMTP